MPAMLTLDGAYGEGGGQILRTALSLSAITGRAVHIHRIRARRPNPGLAAQHLTAVRSLAVICGACIDGDCLGSTSLRFSPQGQIQGGKYCFDVASAREGGSAGAATLVLQAVLIPLALCKGDSQVAVRGGTHLPWCPSFDYLRNVWIPALAKTGIDVTASLVSWGWFPAGGGEILATVAGRGDAEKSGPASMHCRHRGALNRISGRAVAANLPAHIAQRMADRAGSILSSLDVEITITPERVRTLCPGAGIFLAAEYEFIRCGFSAIGERGKSAETVADEATARLLAHHRAEAAFDTHLADQMILPLSLANDDSVFSTDRISRHLATNAWVVEQFGIARITFEKTGKWRSFG